MRNVNLQNNDQFRKKFEKKNINGWLVVDKPIDKTSHDIVNIVKKHLHPNKIGHAGTLDPKATGILILALGEATKAVSYVMDSSKSYEFEISWGIATDSYDSEGAIIGTSDNRPCAEDLLAVINKFCGKIMQTPPIYSAIKINGKRAYELARKNSDIKLNPREVFIEKIKLIEHSTDKSKFVVDCGKGVYIRSLAVDIASEVGCLGYVTYLRRTKLHKFLSEDAILLEKIVAKVYKEGEFDFILPVEALLDDIPVVVFTEKQAKDIRNGKKVQYLGGECKDMCKIIYNDKLVALAKSEGDYIKSLRVFNL